jgi:hypothetical protein
MTDHTHDDLDRSAAPPPGREGMPAGGVFLVMAVCLLGWALLFAPELKRASERQPLGLRRTVSLAFLRPLAAVSDVAQLSDVTGAVQQALGRDPDALAGGQPIFGGEDLTTTSPGPSPSDRPRKGDNGSPSPSVQDTDIRQPTGDDRLRVVVVGDSLADGVGYFAERVFKPFFVDVSRQGQISTGLARLDYFDWFARMQLIVEQYRPDLTIVMLGENDNQSLQTPDGHIDANIGTFEWGGAYEERVELLALIATSDGGHVIWVGLPNERDSSRWPFVQRQNEIFAEVAEQLPNVSYFDTWNTFAAPDGGYTAYYREGDRVELVRADDGVHFNPDGYTLLAQKIAELATRDYQLDPKTYET